MCGIFISKQALKISRNLFVSSRAREKYKLFFQSFFDTSTFPEKFLYLFQVFEMSTLVLIHFSTHQTLELKNYFVTKINVLV